MVSQKLIEDQLKKIDFNAKGWNRSEVAELHNVLLPDEDIYECANGIYEGGFALLVSTDVRVLLIDKKPFGYLNVEDFRFDTISEIDYYHRLTVANMRLTAGSKTLNFRSYDKNRLRKLVGHIQHLMADGKKKQSNNAEGQHQHLEEINQKLQDYLMAQHKQQQKLQQQLEEMSGGKAEVPKLDDGMSEDLKNYLFAQGIVQKYEQDTGKDLKTKVLAEPPAALQPAITSQAAPAAAPAAAPVMNNQSDEIFADGLKEVFGKVTPHKPVKPAPSHALAGVFELNPLKAIYSILPTALQSRKFGLTMPNLPSFQFSNASSGQPAMPTKR